LSNSEGGLAGAAMLAGLGTGALANADEAVSVFVQRERVFEPDRRRHEIYREKVVQFRNLYPALSGILKSM